MTQMLETDIHKSILTLTQFKYWYDFKNLVAAT